MSEDAEVDSSEMLGLRTRSADLVVVGLLAVLLMGLHLTRPSVPGYVYQLGIVASIAVATLVVFRSRGARLPVGAATTAVVLIVVGAVASVPVLGAEPDAVTVLWLGTGWIVPQTFIAARGRQWWAISSVVAVVAVTAGGVALHGGDPGPVLADHVGRLPLVLMSAVFGMAIERRARDIMALRSRSRQKTDEQASAAAALVARDERLGWIRATVGPMLDRIARGERFTEDGLVDVAVLEAHIRDTIRAPGLTGAPLDRVVEDARRRGLTVSLLDDGGARDLGPGAVSRLREIVGARIRETSAPGRLVVRILPPGRPEVVSFAGDASQGRRSYSTDDLANDGTTA